MSATIKILLQLWFFLGMPLVGLALVHTMGLPGLVLFLFLALLWCWELFAYNHYRLCRQEEFVQVLQTAAATQTPVESVLRAYLEGRPREPWYQFCVATLMIFVFPGYYGVHRARSFDAQLSLVLNLLENGVSLDRALRFVPGVVSRQTALAAAVGQFGGNLPLALRHLPDRRSAAPWIDLAPRLLYPLLVLVVLIINVSFLMVFIVPRFEKIFEDFKMRMPEVTEALIGMTRLVSRSSWIVLAGLIAVLGVLNLLLFSSTFKWHLPLVGRLYRLHARGQFMQTLGLMLETGRPLPEIMEYVNESGLLPKVVAARTKSLEVDLIEGRPLAPSLGAHGLATKAVQPLIAAAEKAGNLPWALQELGDALVRRAGRLSYRLAAVAFPLSVFACACLAAFVAVALFSPLTYLMEHLGAK